MSCVLFVFSVIFCLFFLEQKTAYEMRISDWSSDVCSSDLGALAIYFLVATQLTILSVTLYLHRSQAHRAVDFHPLLAHFFRLWTWLTTSMITREWAAIHRKHHAKCETQEEPNSPQIQGMGTVLWSRGRWYREARKLGRTWGGERGVE